MILRPAVREDAHFVWTVNNHPSARRYSISTAEIPWETHARWFARKLEDPNALLLIASDDTGALGVARFDRGEDGRATIGIALAPSHQGRGLGTKLIEAASTELGRRFPGTRVTALVRPANVASQRAFLRAGYVRVGVTVSAGVELNELEQTVG